MTNMATPKECIYIESKRPKWIGCKVAVFALSSAHAGGRGALGSRQMRAPRPSILVEADGALRNEPSPGSQVRLPETARTTSYQQHQRRVDIVFAIPWG